MRRVLLISFLFKLGAVALLSACNSGNPDTPEELRKRADAAQLEWDSYQEDIKSEMGARPAAQWQGQLVQALAAKGRIELRFEVQAPWDSYGVAIPILLRGTFAKVHKNTDSECSGSTHVYYFDLPEESALGNIPWVEVQYPHGTQRISFSDGEWSANN